MPCFVGNDASELQILQKMHIGKQRYSFLIYLPTSEAVHTYLIKLRFNLFIIYSALGCVISSTFVSNQALPLIFLVPGSIEAHWCISFFHASKTREARGQTSLSVSVPPGVAVSMLKAIRGGTLTPAAPAAVYSAVTRRILGNQRTVDNNGGREMACGCQLRPSSAAAKLSCIGDTRRRPLSRSRSRHSPVATVAAQFGVGVGVRDCCEPGHRYSHNAFAKQNKTLFDWISKWVTDTAATNEQRRCELRETFGRENKKWARDGNMFEYKCEGGYQKLVKWGHTNHSAHNVVQKIKQAYERFRRLTKTKKKKQWI